MANTLLTPTIIAKEALMHLENNLVMGALVHRQYKREFKKVGGSITIRKPNKFQVTKTATRSTSSVSEKSITLTVSTQAHVSWDFTTKDLTLTIEEYSERYLKPGAIALANEIDCDILKLYDDVYNYAKHSSSFTNPQNFMVLGDAAQCLDEEAAPQGERCTVLNPAGNWSLANALHTIYVQSIAKDIIRKGYLATIAGQEIYMDQNVQNHTRGMAGTALVNTNTDFTGDIINLGETEHSTIETDWLNVGDIFTIADVHAVNPVSGQSTGQLRRFVVTAQASITTGTTTAAKVSVSIKPSIIDTGAYKTVDTLPADQAAVTVLGVAHKLYPQNLTFHRNAFALVTVPLEMPHGVWGARYSKNGLSIRVLKDYDVDTDEEICRMDVLYGVKTLYPELACRLYGQEAT